MSLVDRSLHFGSQNFFFLNEDTSDGTYDYVGYQSKKGAIFIARFPKDGTSARYCIKAGIFSTVWAAKGTYDYVIPSELIDPSVEE